MGNRERQAKRRSRVAFETLEDRAVPAAFGVPWSDPSHLTLSFVPDGTPIAGHTSSLFQTLGTLQPSTTWEVSILRAFQTWAANANINIGLVSDGGQKLGIAGSSQHDSRFGDIRVGAQLMASDALSISVPNDPGVSSSLTGDVLVNTADDFHKLDLFAVLLHEAGHVFGLDHSTDPNSPLFPQYLGNTKLTAADIANLQSLYGTRAADSHEGSGGNNSIHTATTISPPGGWTGSTPLVSFGDITTNKDVDVFAVRPPSGYNGAVTFRLQSAGLSLLAPRLSILDAKGRVLADGQASSDLGDVVTLQLGRTDPNATYYLRVQGSANDVFGIGSYGVAVTFDGLSTTPVSTIDSVLRGPYQTLSPNDLNALFLGSNTSLINNDRGADDSLLSAITIAPSPGYPKNTHYELLGSISSAGDTDVYRFQTANFPSTTRQLVLTVTLRALAVNGTAPRATLLESDGKVVPIQILANGAGSYTVQASGLKSGGWYFLKVGPAVSAGAAATGNYGLTAQFGTATANLNSLVRGSNLAPGSTATSNLYVAESQLLNLVLAADPSTVSGTVPTSLKLTIRDSSGQVVYCLTAAAGDTVSGPALFLTPGAYTISYTTTGSPLSFQLLGSGISDPIGPVLTDPTLTPDYKDPGLPGWFLYPDGTATKTPILVTPLLLA